MNTSRMAELLSQPWFYNLGFDPSLRSPWVHFTNLRKTRMETEEAATASLPKRPKATAWGDEFRQMEMRESLAIIPVDGALVKGALPTEKFYYGDAADEDVLEDIEKARSDGAQQILLDVKSPGGTAMGAPEFSGEIARLQESGFPIFAFTNELMASKAYYISAGATGIFATPSALVGSIGSILQTVHFERALDERGIDVNIFASGDLKGTGHPAKRLTDPQSSYLQGIVNSSAAEFMAHVEKHRGEMPKEVGRGNVFSTKQALEFGLIDGVVNSRREVEDMILGAT